MGYKCSFLDNQSYTAGDVNDVFFRLSSGGVVFEDTGNTLADLNMSLSEAVTQGVIGDIKSCKLVKDGDTYKVSAGTCFMNDGTSITFDNEGHIIEVPQGVAVYLYFKRNYVMNSIDIEVSEEALSGDEYFLVAEIDAEGNITDRRTCARAKTLLAMPNVLKNISVEFNQCGYRNSETEVIDIGTGAFSYIIMWEGTYTARDNSTEKRVSSERNLFELTENTEVEFPIGKAFNNYKEHLHCRKNGNLVELYLTDTANGAIYDLNLGFI